MSRITGLDLSLASTGIARIVDGRGHVDRVRSAGHNGDTLGARQHRLHAIASTVCARARLSDLVVIESPAYSRTQGAAHDRSGLWWLIVNHLIRHHVPVAEVPPSVRAKFATGRGNAGKDEVLAAVIKRYPDVDVTGNDEADALTLAAMGALHLGVPLTGAIPVTADQARIVAVQRWPERVGA